MEMLKGDAHESRLADETFFFDANERQSRSLVLGTHINVWPRAVHHISHTCMKLSTVIIEVFDSVDMKSSFDRLEPRY